MNPRVSPQVRPPVSPHVMSPCGLLDEARRRLPASLELLEALVRTSSHAGEAEGLARCHAAVTPPLEALGFLVTRRASAAPDPRDASRTLSRHHLVAERPAARQAAPTVLLLGHLDTVFPAEHSFPLEKGAKLWRGPGVADMKGGVVTALLGLELLARAGSLDDATWRVVFVSDEEEGSPTGAPLLRTLTRGVDLAVCFEAAREGGELVVGRKGLGVAEVVARGETGHAGIAHDRAPNALTALARFLVQAEALEDHHSGLTVSPGGPVHVWPAAVNRIPAEARAELEWRFATRNVGRDVERSLYAIARSLNPAQVTVNVLESTPPMASDDPALVESYLAAARALGLRAGAVTTSGVGDINLVAADGAACIDGAGPEGGGFHTNDEYLDVATIAERGAMSALALPAALSALRGRPQAGDA